MEEFRQELSLKREARQRAIAAVSSEMDRLRRELDAEKEAHSETSRVLDLLKSAQAANVKSEATSSTDVSVDAKEDSIREDWRAKLKPDPEQNSNEADAQALTDILKVDIKRTKILKSDIFYSLKYGEIHKHIFAYYSIEKCSTVECFSFKQEIAVEG